jgi:hypothetical protein
MSLSELYTETPELEVFYDLDHDKRLTVQIDNRWADFCLVENADKSEQEYSKYVLAGFGPVLCKQGRTQQDMNDLYFIIDQLKQQIPSLKMKGHTTLYFSEECRALIKLRFGFDITQG